MAKSLSRVYWDACAWISFINKEMPSQGNNITEKRYEMCRNTLKMAENGDLEILTSAFTLAEVCKRSPSATGPSINLASFFDQKYIFLVNVDKQIGVKAQSLQLAGFAGLKPPDAIHLASAIIAEVPVFHTFDGALLGLSEKFALNDGKNLKILRPTEELPTPDLLKMMQTNDQKTDPN